MEFYGIVWLKWMGKLSECILVILKIEKGRGDMDS